MKNQKEYIIVENAILLKDYESSVARADQIKQRALDIAKDVIDLLQQIKAALTTNPTQNAVFALFLPFDDKNFILPRYMLRVEYNRLELDTFGRIK